jgi:5-(carboxyamino)imidazole ribonucleotide synthase
VHIGILGTGQLGRMMVKSAKDLDHSFCFGAIAGDDQSSVSDIAKIIDIDESMTAVELFAALGKPDVITIEKEAVNARLLEELAELTRVAPNPKAIAISQNRHLEKGFIAGLNIPTVDYRCATNSHQVIEAVQSLAYPLIIKSSEQGYDGKNQWRLKEQADLNAFLASYADQEVIIERHVNFDAELSMIASRSVSGEIKFYPLTENYHHQGVLLTSKAFTINQYQHFATIAQNYLESLLQALDYVGVLSMECFVVEQQLLINEIAPRVHNSGHWTQVGTETCQFENHIRAITDMPLGDTSLLRPSAMVNILGKDQIMIQTSDSASQINWYGKSIKPNRKVGHINITADESSKIEKAIDEIMENLYQID